MTAIYVTSPDRAGVALLTGAVLGSVPFVVSALLGGERDLLALTGTLLGGALASALLIVALGGPAWLLMRGRGPVAAAFAGLLVVFLVVLSAQTYGLGIAMPIEDGRTLAARWFSAAAVAGAAGLAGAGLAVSMWLVGYRRL